MALIRRRRVWEKVKKLAKSAMSLGIVEGIRRPRQYGKKTKAAARLSIARNGEGEEEDDDDDEDNQEDEREAEALAEIDANRASHSHGDPRISKSKPGQKRGKKPKSPLDKPTERYLKPILRLGGKPTTFDNFAGVLEEQSVELKKVAEGSYAEVFELKSREGTAILKLVPIKPERGETVMLLELAQMTSVASLAAELITLQRLQYIPGFSQFVQFQVLLGRQTGAFKTASREFRESGGHSEFPDPSAPYAYDEDQLWCAIEMSHGGAELDKEVIEHPLVIWDAFWGVCFALAKAEVEINFEHRDLHPSNVCIRIDRQKAERRYLEDKEEDQERKKKRNKGEADTIEKEEKTMGKNRMNEGKNSKKDEAHKPASTAIRIGYTGITTTLIDYTLSRTSASQTAPADIRPSRHSLPMEDIAPDLEQQLSIFAMIDPGMQFSVYRWMRSIVCFDDRLNLELGHMDKNEVKIHSEKDSKSLKSLKSSKSSKISKGSRQRKQKVETVPSRGWETYEPLTNVFWLHFLLTTLLERFRIQPINRGWRFPLPNGSDYLQTLEELDTKGTKALRCLELIDMQLNHETELNEARWKIDSASSLVATANDWGFINMNDYEAA